MPTSSLALATLIAANLVPLAGTLAFGWSVSDVLVLYWAESGIIGLMTIAKMVTAGHERSSAFFSVPFLTLHYGAFWVAHGVAVVQLFGLPDGAADGLGSLGAGTLLSDVGVAVAALLVSHTASYVENWWRAGERLGAAPMGLLFAPYGRVVALHLTVVLGAVAVEELGSPVAALAILVAIKLGLDVAAHLREHRSARRRTAAAQDAREASPARG